MLGERKSCRCRYTTAQGYFTFRDDVFAILIPPSSPAFAFKLKLPVRPARDSPASTFYQSSILDICTTDLPFTPSL